MGNDVIALVGNANSGKTTLFNTLTGTYQKTGNWTGVTVTEKIGYYKENKSVKIVDLPGIYSLAGETVDERVVTDYIKNTPPKVIINVIDGTNMERNLCLTTELCELNVPMIIAVNMYDELQRNGLKLHATALCKLFGCPVVPVSAITGENVHRLIEEALKITTLPKQPIKPVSGTNATLQRFKFIEANIGDIIEKKITGAERRTLFLDGILMHRIWALPILFIIMFAVYFLSITCGGFIGNYVNGFFGFAADTTSKFLKRLNASDWVSGLFCDAILGGLGSVLSFMPQILILFALMAFIELSGYASRIAFILDRFFRSFGLGGKSFIPMMVSCGCTVPGLMATRIIENKSERIMTVFLSPFMPCGAKMAVFSWFSSKLFGGNALVATSIYFLSLFCVAVFGNLLKRIKFFKGEESFFILEMPNLKLPSIKDVVCVLAEKAKDFLIKAGSIILLVSVVLWTLQNVGPTGYTGGNIETSFLFILGNAIKYIFYPLGFGTWQASISVIAGFMAKEAVIETLEIVATDPGVLFYNGFSAYAFMVFILLSPPCVSAIATAKRELGSKKLFVMMLLFQFFTGYVTAFIINIIGILIEYFTCLIFLPIVAIITVTVICRRKNRRKKYGKNGDGNLCLIKTKRYTT